MTFAGVLLSVKISLAVSSGSSSDDSVYVVLSPVVSVELIVISLLEPAIVTLSPAFIWIVSTPAVGETESVNLILAWSPSSSADNVKVVSVATILLPSTVIVPESSETAIFPVPVKLTVVAVLAAAPTAGSFTRFKVAVPDGLVSPDVKS